MRCPKCTSIEDKVIDSRISKEGNTIRRRRECLECGNRFTTTETLVLDGMVVIKRFGLLKNKTMYGKPVTGVERTTFVIGPDAGTSASCRESRIVTLLSPSADSTSAVADAVPVMFLAPTKPSAAVT